MKHVNTTSVPAHVRESVAEVGFSSVEALVPGDTIRANHVNCPAGEDSRERLYVTRFENGNRLGWYCHNCSQGGTFATNAKEMGLYRTAPHAKTTTAQVLAARVALEKQKEGIVVGDRVPFADLPIAAAVYFDKYGITPCMYAKHNLTYNFATNSIESFGHDPISDDDPFYSWIQKRRLDSNVRTRYIQERSNGFSGIAAVTARENVDAVGTHLVIAEDYISAIRIAEVDSSYIGGHNFGVQVKALEWGKFIAKYPSINSVTIWFDNDGQIPEENAFALARVLKASFPNLRIRVVTKLSDPKKYSDIRIRENL